VAPIKALFDFAKNNEEKPEIHLGLVDGQVTNQKQLEVISKLPSKDQLIAQVVGGLKSPLNGIAGVLNGVQRNFVYALAEIAKQKA
jgi:large subunit ribosomal protein L10